MDLRPTPFEPLSQAIEATRSESICLKFASYTNCPWHERRGPGYAA